MRKLAVTALGGNALLLHNQVGTISEQEDNVRRSCEHLLRLIKEDYSLVITHGNGPQVGNILLKNEAGNEIYKLPKMPLDVCVAETQGSIGYMIEQQLSNVLREHGIERKVITLITQVVVDKSDPAFQDPTKPVGRYFMKEEADLLAKANKWVFREDAKKKAWRRVVPSPQPQEVLNTEMIRFLLEHDYIVVAVGGGGIPAFRKDTGELEGIDAVIDKDLASSVLASNINADELYILTDIPKVMVNFRKPGEKALDTMTVAEAEELIANGEFGAGSMLPKVQASLKFVQATGNKAVITEAATLGVPNGGTIITL